MNKHIIILLLLVSSAVIYSQTWINQTVTPQPPPLYSVSAYSNNIAWASGDEGTVLYTSNGGANWFYRGSSFFIFNTVYSVRALDPVTAVCICNISGAGKIFKTTNGGVSWFQVFSRNGLYLNDIEFVGATTGFAYGDPYQGRWFVMKTTNGGASFDTTITRPLAPTGFEIGFPNALHLFQASVGGPISVWFTSDISRIYHSTNSGVAWDTNDFTPGNSENYAVTFINANTGFASGNQPYMTTNGGNTWSIQANYPNLGTFYSFANTAGKVWYSSGPSICVSTNNGGNFILQYTNPPQEVYRHMSFVTMPGDNILSTVTGWAVTEDGSLSKYTETIGITPVGTTIPKVYTLNQNFPNPFNPVTKIRFELPKKDLVSLTVYDILGNEITELYRGNLNAGIYESDFDATNLSSGIYLYKLQTSGFTETKKMIVVK